MSSIKVTPETLESQGNELNGYAVDLEEILSSIDSKVQEIDAEWDGLAQEGYIEMYDELKENLKKFPELVASLGASTIQAAEAFQSVDQDLQTSFGSAVS